MRVGPGEVPLCCPGGWGNWPGQPNLKRPEGTQPRGRSAFHRLVPKEARLFLLGGKTPRSSQTKAPFQGFLETKGKSYPPNPRVPNPKEKTLVYLRIKYPKGHKCAATLSRNPIVGGQRIGRTMKSGFRSLTAATAAEPREVGMW
ncbi:hypothetical protein GWK47_027896 [Chionoecetes opilio]|uniref:Uncharacterized protein n=1 Tax=Chionoecetes opilio TaxID=41210 RepID=A0A8J8WMD1_CHIOP|nr:hypothetical protein GWK47_027896 [Chionoecetes opilio]